jgi:hypothetical protein
MANELEDFQGTMERYSNYLERKPLNEELAAVQRGEVDLVEHPVEKATAKRAPIEDSQRELTKGERLDLRELRQSEGWPVLMRILEKRFLQLEKAAITMSHNDPLGKSREIGEKWAYVVAYKMARMDLESMLDTELQVLRKEEQ